MEASGQVNIDNDGSEVIGRNIAVKVVKKDIDKEELYKQYEITSTVQRILKEGYNTIALQFPDELLRDSALVAAEIERLTSKKVVVLGDTTFGSCCVDEVAAQHVNSDLVVHYGNTCLSNTSNLPVLYVYTQREINVESAANKILDGISNLTHTNVLILSDKVYNHAEEKLLDLLTLRNSDTTFKHFESNSELFFDPKRHKENSSTKNETIIHSVLENLRTGDDTNTAIVYIGNEGAKLSNLIITNSRETVYSYSPETDEFRQESGSVNRHLGKRYFVMQKARDARVVGLVVGTLSADKYIAVVEKLKEIFRLYKIKFYVILAGKINAAKLANFTDIETFVIVACPENSLVDSKEFYQPVVTPYEMITALQSLPNFNSEYTTDFQSFLKRADEIISKENMEIKEKEHDSDSEAPRYSLITGKLVSSRKLENTTGISAVEYSQQETQLSVRDRNNQVAAKLQNVTYENFQDRIFKGLEIDETGDLKPEIAVEGRSGIAKNYNFEPKD
ncbi:hypothetical protein BB559_006015 [Furculomyces boomerangus]|uniref:2-(3-amino-3-carboxypropyl)histidine synthase subunit 2 n=2 Tax=Harpellales TaxID=61421 RepID=A0A2T9Y5B1_9FUNG|nr:hypothetical protein BB559_006655 [Furculomyces boomerangus]PVU87497.1 hypothetical protein BB559_006015 [Furculomyces boomerangus]PWA00402.1 hypothetical protein BB558_003555 [Smittium angustum]